MEQFWKIFDERLELCHKALRCRHERLKGTLSDISPIHWQHGAIARLKPGEPIDKLLYDGYSTISLGYAGLYECVKYMTGKSHTIEKTFALSVMQHLNDACAKWKEEENIDYSVYGTPLESTTYKFAKCLKKRFGVIDGVTNKNYITNSYHVHVTEPINAFDKLKFESEFQPLSPGGAISYVEVPNMQNNIPAVIALIQCIYDNIMYAELNTKSDYCQECGYDGEIQIVEDEDGKLLWECPNCGNRDQNKINVSRRTCGYIGTQYWNQGRKVGDPIITCYMSLCTYFNFIGSVTLSQYIIETADVWLSDKGIHLDLSQMNVEKVITSWPRHEIEESRAEFLGQLIDCIEDFLEEKGVYIPSKDRDIAITNGEDPEGLALIYGEDYNYLADAFVEILHITR